MDYPTPPLKIEWWHHWIRPAPWPKNALTLPRFQAHRGFHLEGLQENSLEAFREARRRGAECCECDVQLSADHVPVIFHDMDLERIAARRDRVDSLTAAELGTAARIPTLAELLSDPAVPPLLNIEIKSSRVKDPVTQAVVKVIRECKAENRVLISSFNPFVIRKLQKLLPEVPRALLVTSYRHPKNKWYLRRIFLGPLLRVQMLNLDERMLTPAVIRFWKKKKMPLAAWTVNDATRARELLSHHVDSIISDRLKFDQIS